MKINRGFYYFSVLAGATLLILSSGFRVVEVGLALGFVLLMAGLYGLSRPGRSPEKPPRDTSDGTSEKRG